MNQYLNKVYPSYNRGGAVGIGAPYRCGVKTAPPALCAVCCPPQRVGGGDVSSCF